MVDAGYSISENRILMYSIYTVIATVVYGIIFSISSNPGLWALSITIAFLLKDVIVDMIYLKERKSPWLYDYVEHNPFNYVLIIALLFVVDASATVADIAITENMLIGLAITNLLIDGAQDFSIEFSQ